MADQNNKSEHWEEEVNVVDYVRILFRYRYFILIFTLLVGLLGFGVNYFVLNPVYRAESILLVVKPEVSLKFEPKIETPYFFELQFEKAKAILMSHKVRAQVAENLQLGPGVEPLTPKFLQDIARVEDDKSGIIRLAVYFRDPKIAAEIVNEWVNIFIKEVDLLYNRTLKDRIGFIKERFGTARQELQKAEIELKEFTEKSIIRQLRLKLDKYNTKLVELQLQEKELLAQADYDLNYIRELENILNRTIFVNFDCSKILTSELDEKGKENLRLKKEEAWRLISLCDGKTLEEAKSVLNTLLENTDKKLAELKNGKNLKNDALKATLNYYLKIIVQIREQLEFYPEDFASRIIDSGSNRSGEIKKELERLKINHNLIRKQLEQIRARADELQAEIEKIKVQLAEQEFNQQQLERKRDEIKLSYDVLVTKIEETKLAGLFIESPLKVVDRASAPELPVKPKKLTNTVICLVIGLLVSVFMSFVFNFFRQHDFTEKSD